MIKLGTAVTRLLFFFFPITELFNKSRIFIDIENNSLSVCIHLSFKVTHAVRRLIYVFALLSYIALKKQFRKMKNVYK